MRGSLANRAIPKAAPGLTTKVMQERFRKLEGWGLISRVRASEKPLHVEYRLTAKGRQLRRVLAGIHRFAARWESAPGVARGAIAERS